MIFKKYKNYFLKSESRVSILDEKFKKHIDKGYLSKNSLDDYNRYFSNYVSELQTTDVPDLDTQRIYTELIDPQSLGKSSGEFYSKETEETQKENFNISNAFAESENISYEMNMKINQKWEAPSFRKFPVRYVFFKIQN